MADDTKTLALSVTLDTGRLRSELSDLARLGDRFGHTMVRAFAGAVTGGRKFSTVLRSLLLSLSGQALSAALRPLGSALGGAFGTLFGGLTANASGNAFSDGRSKRFAAGGIVNSPTLFPLRSGTGLMGEAGPEAILPLARGRDGKLGVRAEPAARPVTVNVTIATPDLESFRRSQGQVAAALVRGLEHGRRNL